MSIDIVTTFLERAPHDPASAWNYTDVTDLAAMTIPPALFGDQESLLRGDQHRLWLRWFLEGLVSPHTVASDPTLGRLDVFAAVLSRVSNLYPLIDIERRRRLTDTITNHIFAEVQRLRRGTARDYATASTKLALIAGSTPPRCYICGFAFSREAQDAFLNVKGRNSVQLPLLVDVFRPRGLVERDIKIEVDHLVPVAIGGSGQANLRLACGWCNKHKSARVSLYEAAFMAPRTQGFSIGQRSFHELPNPFWAIRILALRGRCQHVGGCQRTAADAELFISLGDWLGSPNPTNLAVHCFVHDPIAADRMQERLSVERLWRERKG